MVHAGSINIINVKKGISRLHESSYFRRSEEPTTGTKRSEIDETSLGL